MRITKQLLPSKRIPILVYHRISMPTPEEAHLGLAISPSSFSDQMRYLYDQGYTTLTIDEFSRHAFEETRDERKSIVITFDDGYLDTYTNAYPVLEKYGFSATIFITTDFMGKTHRWPRCHPVPYMTWAQAKEMADDGMTFQSHTCTHPDLTSLGNATVMGELFDSKSRIEDKLGVPVWHVSYPFGYHDSRIKTLVEEVGYRSACALNPAKNDRFSLERYIIYNTDDPFLFSMKLRGWECWIRKNILSIWKRQLPT